MKRYLVILAALVGLTACEPTTMQPTNQATATGAVTGAVLGAALADSDDRLEGAVLGGAAGAIAGTLIGRAQNQPNKCVYRDAYGNNFVADC